MSWNKVPIKTICKGIYDGPHATPPESSSGAVFLGIPNFINGQLDLSNIRYISEQDLPKWTKRVTPQPNDIVFSYEATLNLYAIIPKGFWGCLGRRMALIRVDEKKADYKFLYYYFYSPAWRSVIQEHTVTGATVDRIPLVSFPDFLVELPDLPTQRRIASILSAYDDLIENNRRQIKLLEEAAQRLYREWFVELRFPGHESVKVVDGVPEGWMKGTLNTIAEFTGKKANKAERERYKCYLPIDCLPKKSLAYINHDNISNAESSLLSFAKYDIIFGAMRPYFHKVVIAQEEGLTRSTCFVINSRSKEYWSYVCMLLFSEEAIDYATHVSVGTTMPYVRWKDFERMPVLIPSQKVAAHFHEMLLPIIQKISCIAKHIALLSEARDRLLPKLMSGEMEASE